MEEPKGGLYGKLEIKRDGKIYTFFQQLAYF